MNKEIKSAMLSDCGSYRYTLKRSWGAGKSVCFIGINPSTADSEEDDATIRKMRGFSKKLNCESFSVVNLYAYRSTDVKNLGSNNCPLPVDHTNMYYIKDALLSSDVIIPCWGNITKIPKELRGILDYLSVILERNNIKCWCLGKTKSGCPKHPLMLSYETELEEYRV